MLFLAQLGFLEQCSHVTTSTSCLSPLLLVQSHLSIPLLILKTVDF